MLHRHWVRRSGLHNVAAGLLTLAGLAQARSPSTVRMLVGFAPGADSDAMACLRAGKLRRVAMIGPRRQALLPGVPAAAEISLAGFEDLPACGIGAPQGRPRTLIDRYAGAVVSEVALPDVREHLTALGLNDGPMSSQQFDAREKAYSASGSRMITASGFLAQ
jgi:tripartite-type tricarboxylate transporter receptor subunit TctC